METEKKPAEEVIWTKVRSRKKWLKKCRSSSNRLKFAHVTWYLWGRGWNEIRSYCYVQREISKVVN